MSVPAILTFGEILWDCFADHECIGGALAQRSSVARAALRDLRTALPAVTMFNHGWTPMNTDKKTIKTIRVHRCPFASLRSELEAACNCRPTLVVKKNLKKTLRQADRFHIVPSRYREKPMLTTTYYLPRKPSSLSQSKLPLTR
ncbi:MAG: hypothetical protein LBK76_03230 [Verrucomicrobiales bacterium]|jgi:hypothetical protein|nr:hypothetical protein [Verrucomicrobiales bacterium]